MKSLFSFVCAPALIAALPLAASAQASPAQLPPVSAADFMKIRCHPEGKASFTHWSGNVTTAGPGAEKAQTLFKIVGFNVARCYVDAAGNWMVSSRELTYFLDPVSGARLDTWSNPWTGEKVPVVHIANALVQQKIPAAVRIPVETLGATSIVRLDVPLSYPNPLAGDERFSPYSPEAFYKAHESFTYVLGTDDLQNMSNMDALNDVQVSWTRVSPWMPWMKMKGAAGYLVYNAIVQKTESFAQLPELIRNEVSSRLPLYADAPECIVENRANVSSWTYFKENFAQYQAGLTFPLPAPLSLAQGECPAK